MTEQTSRLSIVVDTTNAQQRLAQFRQGLRQTTTNTNQAGQGLQGLQQNTDELAISTERLNGIYRDCAGRLHHANGRFISLAEAMRQTGLSAEQLHRHFDRVGNSANTAGNAVNRFSSPLSRINDLLRRTQAIISGGLFGMFALSVAKTADTMQDLNSQIMLVTKNEQEQLVVKERLHQMANKNLTDLKSTIGLYTNSARALGNMGKSQEEVLKFTNAVSLAMGVGGKSATEQASALLQLGQAMQSGVLQGDEFRSLAENAPIMLDLIAEKLGKTRGEVRKMASDGEITTEVVYDSLSGATDKLQAMFDKMPVTMSQAFGVVKNNYNVFVDNFINKTTGLSGAVAKGLIGISNHFETIAKVAIAGTGLALVGLASKVTLTTTAFTALKTVMMTHPVLAVATAVLGVSSAFFGLNDVLDTTGLVFGELFGLVKTGLGGLADLAWAVGFNITNAFSDSNDKTSQSFFGFFDNTGKGFLGFLHGVTRIVATMSATFVGFLTWIGNGFWQALRGVANIFIWLKNKADSVVQSMVNGVLDGIDKVIDKVNALIGGANSMLANTPLEIQIKPISKTSYRYQATPTETFDLTGKTLSEHIAPWVANANGGVDTMFASLYSEQAKRNQQAQADLAKATDANTKSVNDNTKDKKGDKKEKDYQLMVYQAFKNAGLSDNQSFALTAEVGRENEYNTKYLFGGHIDASNKKQNLGMISWQGSRRDELLKYLNQAGVIKNGKIEHTQQALDAQARFLVKEIMEKSAYKTTKDKFLANESVDYKTAYEVLGDNLIRWDRSGRAVLGKKGAERHAKKRDDYYAQITAKVGNSDVVKDFQKDIKEQQKILDDFAKKLQSPVQKIIQEKEATLSELEKVLSKDDALYQQYAGQIEKASDFELYNHLKSVRDEIDNVNGYRISEEQKIQQKFADMRAEFDLNPKFSFWSDENKAKYKQAIDDAEQYSLEQYRLTLAEKMAGLNDFHKTEIQKINEKYDLEERRIKANNELPEVQEAQLAHNKKLRQNDVLTATDNARNNYTDVMANLYGFGRGYQGEKQAFDAWKTQFEAVKSAMDMGIIQQEKYYKILADIDNQYLANKQAIMVGSYQQIFGTLGGLMRAFGGEQSKVYQVMANIEKGYALYKTFLANKTAIATAWASAPFPYNIPAVAKATLETGLLQSAIESFTPKGFKTGGYTGNVGTSQVAGVVHGQEYVLNANATKRIGVDNLNRLNRGENIGSGQTVIVNVTVNSDGTANVDSQAQMGKQMGEAIKIAVQQELRREKMQGGALYGR